MVDRFPLRIEQAKDSGWWFISVEGVAGLSVFGPSYEDLLDQLKVAAVDLFRARGETVTDVEITSVNSGDEAVAGPWVRSEKPALQVM